MIKISNAPSLAAGLLAGLLTFGLAGSAAAADEIFAAQNALYGAGYDIDSADGQMGPSTRSALEQFQQDHPDLQVTGELNDDTREALGLVTTEVVSASSSSAGAAQEASTSSSSANASGSDTDAPEAVDSAGSDSGAESSEGDIEEEDDGSWSFF
ncbi:peptidoglycan-binding protein [Tamilnaduibacter salinus]|uniref:Peptidoglycan-binding protein n=1 Tax=Tamilnaduibacter salinus TaxID=1484056 RepID=A0A2A2I3Z8_9GAMM|nr:peptidoglycan-binding domain-containing protein [Tamilnaduibacter salinus]PAV26014.1 peptidoglycan-binding protein [Tamilnaduibacter salinus]